MKHKFEALFFCALLAGSVLIADSAYAQTKAYRQTNLASSVPGDASNIAPNLINPSGIAYLPGQSFFIADSGSGFVDSQNSAGVQAGVVGVPVPRGNMGLSMPAGIASDGSGVFGRAGAPIQFVVVTQEGTISGFLTPNGDIPTRATLVRDDSASGTVYTALALLHPECCAPFAAVANFNDGLIHTFTASFDMLDGPGSFKDPNLPAGYAPFGMQVIGNQLFVTYALQDAAKRGPVIGAGNGVVNVFDSQGHFVRRFATGGSLNAPWGVTFASANFGPFSGAVLVGNCGDGTISAYDPATGNFLGQISDGDGNVISNPGIRGLTFRTDGVADPSTLYFTSGNSNGQGGLFGAITTGLVSATRASVPGATVNMGTTVTATVDAGPSNPGMPSGSVAIADGGVPQGTAPLVNGVATFPLAVAGMGTHVIDVQFSGDARFLPSSSRTEMQVTGMGTTVALTAPADVAHGSAVTLTAAIHSTGGTPSGSIAFHDGAIALGSAALNAMGAASLTVSTLGPGTHSLTASFPGSGTFAGSTSATVITDVAGAPDFSVSATPSSVTVSRGQSSPPIMVTIMPTGGFTGSVTLACTSVTGITCTFASMTLSTASGPASTLMTIHTTTTVPRYGFVWPGMIGLSGLLAALGLLSLLFWRGGKFQGRRVPALSMAGVLTVFALSFALGGCGYTSSTYTPPQNPGPAALTITAQSGAITHTATVNVTVQ